MNPVYESIGESIFARMTALALKHGAVNLGQGFPDFGWPDEILEAAARALTERSNQYAPARGLPEFREAIAAHYNRHQGMALTADHVCVTSGGTEALAACILATIEPGDEVIILTPAYDCYAPTIRRAGGIVREVALQPPEWRIGRSAIEQAITPRTRAILFNNPHNPAARLFAREELETITAVALEHDLMVISDEVWEHVVLHGQGFTPLASLPGMAERVLKVGSAGKIFSLTGWKVGWIVAAPALASVVARAHQFLTFATPPNLQWAVAYGLDEGDAWIEPMKARFQRARDRMTSGLEQAGFAVLGADATYFLCVDLEASGISMSDVEFADAAVERAGVATVPLSVFAERQPARHLVRLCFGKKDETIDGGVAAMAHARELFGKR